MPNQLEVQVCLVCTNGPETYEALSKYTGRTKDGATIIVTGHQCIRGCGLDERVDVILPDNKRLFFARKGHVGVIAYKDSIEDALKEILE